MSRDVNPENLDKNAQQAAVILAFMFAALGVPSLLWGIWTLPTGWPVRQLLHPPFWVGLFCTVASIVLWRGYDLSFDAFYADPERNIDE